MLALAQKNVAVLIYDGVELVDMNGPIDVFLHANAYSEQYNYNVYTVASSTATVISESFAVRIEPAYDFRFCPEPDIIIIPGAIVNGNVGYPDDAMIEWILQMGQAGKTIMSVCIGAFILASTGLLSGRQATTHYQFISDFEQSFPDVEVEINVRYVADGNFVSTGGITSGIDGALYLLSVLDALSVAEQTACVMVYTMDAPLPPCTIIQ